MKIKLPLLLASLLAFALAGCVSSTAPVSVTSTQQTIANAAEDAISIGLVPVLAKNPSYIGVAQAVALALGSFSGDTLTADDVNAFLAKTTLAPQDAQTVAGIVNAAWAVFEKRYAQQVGAATRPDVKLFLAAVSNGIKAAVAATPRS